MRTPSKILVIVLSLLCVARAAAQNDVNVVVQIVPPYSPYLSDYIGVNNKLIVTLQNTTNNTLDVRFVGSLTGNNGVSLVIPDGTKGAFPVTLQPNQARVIYGKDLEGYLDPDVLQIQGITKQELVLGNGLPEGDYSLCLQVKEFNGNNALSKPAPSGCGMFTIKHAEPPMVIQPTCGNPLQKTVPQNIVFSWTSPAGVPANKVEYVVTLVEVYPINTDPNQAILAATDPPFFRTTVSSTTLVYGLQQPPLEAGKKYAWRVQARPKQGVTDVFFKNDGYSVACSFTYTQQGEEDNNNQWANDDQGSWCSTRACGPPAPAAVPGNTTYSNGDSVRIGYFTLVLTDVSNGTATNLSGSGVIRAPFFRCNLRATFTGLKVNAEHKVYQGAVNGAFDPGLLIDEKLRNFTESVDNLTDVAANKVKEVSDYVKSAQKALPNNIDINLAGQQPISLPFAFSKMVSEKLQLINIVSIEFKPDGARFNAFLDMPIPEANNKTLAFGIKNVCFHPKGLALGGIQKLTMIGGDYTFPWGQNIQLTLKSSKNNAEGTYVKWNCDGFQEFQIAGWFTFNETILQKKQGQGQVKGNFLVNAGGWGDVLGNVTMDEFVVAGFRGMTFNAASVYVDLSDTRNLQQQVGFPTNYQGSQGVSWKGIYIPELSVTLPAYLKKNNQPITLALTNAIIGTQGFTGTITASNLVTIDNGDVGGWGFSLNSVSLAWKNSALEEGSLAGGLRLPISQNTQLSYSGTVSSSANGVKTNFSVQLGSDVDVNMWVATMKLQNGSSISLTTQGNDVTVTAVLNGTIDIKGQAPELKNIQLDMPSISFNKFTLSNKAPYFVDGTFAFASPQKTFAGFPININKAGPIQFVKDNANNPNEVGLNMGLSIGFDGNGSLAISGETHFTLWAKKQNVNGKMRWVPSKAQLTDIAVHGETPVMVLDGAVNIFDGDPTYGDGFRGAISVMFKPKMQIAAVVQFGKVDGYRYWFVDALVRLPAAIPVSPGFGFWGFGGGAYFNMKRASALPEAAGMEDAGQNEAGKIQIAKAGQSLSGVTYVPFKPPGGNLFGFQAKILMGTMPTPTMFNGDISIEAAFHTNGGLEYIGLVGNGYFFTPPNAKARPAKPILAANIEFYYYAQLDKFTGKLGCELLLPPPEGNLVRGGGEAQILFEPGRWYIKFGTPTKPFGFDVLDGVVKAQSYMMCGKNGLDPIPPIPYPEIDALLNKPTRDPSVNATGTGFAFGQYIKLGGKKYKFLIFYAQFGIDFGFDIAVLHQPIACENAKGGGIQGMNGWIVDGQAYASVFGSVGIDINLWFLKADIELFGIEAKVAVKARLPNPSWVAGAVSGSYSVLNGLLSGTMSFKFEAGEKCIAVDANPLDDIEIVADANPKGQSVDPFVFPEVLYNFPVGLQPNATDAPLVAVKTVDSEGNPKMLEFKFGIEKLQLERRSGNAWVTVDSDASLESKNTITTIIPGGDNPVMLEPQTQHRITVWVYGVWKKNGSWKKIPVSENDASTYYEKRTYTFTTGKAPEYLVPGNIIETYPRRMARYIYRNDATKGFLRFRAFPTNFLTLEPKDDKMKFSYRVRYQEIGSGSSVIHDGALTFDQDNNAMTFDVPSAKLKKEKIYIVQFIRRTIPKSLANQQGMEINANPDVMKNVSYGQNVLRMRERKLGAIRLGDGEFLIYQMAFKTSKYDRFEDKIEKYLASTPTRKFGSKSSHYTTFTGDEPLDWYEQNATTYNISQSVTKRVMPPLMPIALDRPSDKGPWWGRINSVYLNNLKVLKTPLRTTKGKYNVWNDRVFPMPDWYPPGSELLRDTNILDMPWPRWACQISYTGNGLDTRLTDQEINAVYWKNMDPDPPQMGFKVQNQGNNAPKPNVQGANQVAANITNKIELQYEVINVLWTDAYQMCGAYTHDSKNSTDGAEWNNNQSYEDAMFGTGKDDSFFDAIGIYLFEHERDSNLNYNMVDNVNYPVRLRYQPSGWSQAGVKNFDINVRKK